MTQLNGLKAPNLPSRPAGLAGAVLLGAALAWGAPAAAQRAGVLDQGFGQMLPRAIPAQAAPAAAAPARDLAEAATRPPLAVGAVVPLALSGGQAVYFRLPEGAGDLIALTRALARGTDTVLALLDAQGRVLAEDDDGGEEGLASRIEVTADQAGPLFLRVNLLDPGDGRFELVLQQPPPGEPAGGPLTLTEAVGAPGLAVGVAATITLRGRQEVFFRLPAGGQDLVVMTRGLARGTDTVIALLDANGREVAEDDDGGEENLASRLEVPSSQRRPLYVRAGTLTGGGRFDLVLVPDTAPATPGFPTSLREAAAAEALAVGQVVPLALRRGQRAVFRLPEGDIAVLTRNLRRNADTVLTLLDADGRELAEDDDGGGGLASRLEVPASQARPAFIRAGILGGGSGEFDLVVEADSQEVVAFPTSLQAAAAAAPLQRSTAVTIRLKPRQSAFFLLPPGAHVVMTRALRSGSDSVLELLDANGQVLAEDDDGGEENLASRLEVDGSQKGDVFVRAGILSDNGGGFDLILLPPAR